MVLRWSSRKWTCRNCRQTSKSRKGASDPYCSSIYSWLAGTSSCIAPPKVVLLENKRNPFFSECTASLRPSSTRKWNGDMGSLVITKGLISTETVVLLRSVRFGKLTFRPQALRQIQLRISKKGNHHSIECVHMTSRRPRWRSKQRNGSHLGGVKYSFGDWTLFLCKFLLLFYYANMASGHMSEHTLYLYKLTLHSIRYLRQAGGHVWQLGNGTWSVPM